MDQKSRNEAELSRLSEALALSGQRERELEETRRAMLFLLEDLETNRLQIETAKREWTAVFDAIRDPVMLHDREFRILRANQAYAQRAGLEFNAFVGRRYWEVFPFHDGPLPGCQAIVDTIGSTGDARPMHEELSLPTGETYLSHAYPALDAQGAHLFSVHIFENITERKRARHELELKHAILFTQQETSLDGILVVDADGRIISYNRRFVDMWAIPAELVAAGEDEPVLRYVVGRQTDPAAFLARVQHLYEHRDEKSQEQLALWDGRTVDRYSAPMFGTDGAYYGRIWYFRDITAQTRAVQGLRDSEEKFRALTENASDITAIISGEGLILYQSPSTGRLLGYGQDELLNRNIFDLVHADDQARARAAFAACLESPGVVQTVDSRIRHHDGSWRTFETKGTYLPGAAHLQGLVINARDVTDRTQAEVALQRVNRALRVLSECSVALVHAVEEHVLLAAICRIIVEIGNYRLAWVGFAEQDAEKSVRAVAQHGHDDDYLQQARISWADTERGRGPTGIAIRTATTQIVQNLLVDPAMALWHEQAIQRGYASCIAVPLKEGPSAFGVLTIYAAEPDAFNSDEVRLLEELAADLAYGIAALRLRLQRDRFAEAQRHHEQALRASLVDSIQAIAATVEMRDPYTAGHQRRVAQLCVAIGHELGIGEDRLQGLNLAAGIHDVGKIRIPAEILSKPGRLSAIEFELIKAHSQAGYDIIKDVKFPWPIAQIILQHHERMDGSGYPQGLRGDAILLESRILTVADVVEAMASYRPYRPALGIEAALQEIITYRGSSFDPAVVDACVNLFREQRFSFDLSG